MGGNIPKSTGTGLDDITIDPGTLALTAVPAPGTVCVIKTPGAGNQWKWGTWEVVQWKFLPAALGGDRELLKRFKDGWIVAHKSTIKEVATQYRLPTLLVAGVAWVEVGGDPDWKDPLGFAVRRIVEDAASVFTRTTDRTTSDKTSFGDVSIQIRRAAESVGLPLDTLDDESRLKILSCLEDEDANLGIVARHLAALRDVDFAGVNLLGDEQIRVIATRYNRGPEAPLSSIKSHSSYGDLIIKLKTHLLGLLE